MNLDIGYTQLIIEKAQEYRVPLSQLAYILATAYHETNFTMEPVEEAYYLKAKYGWTDAKLDAWRARNLAYYPWHGRGFVQLTWEDNYIRAAAALDIDLVDNPLLAMEPEPAAAILVVGMLKGWFTGRKLDDYINDTQTNYVYARKIVNGLDKAETIAGYAREYAEDLESAGYTPVPKKFDLTALLKEIVSAFMKGFKK